VDFTRGSGNKASRLVIRLGKYFWQEAETPRIPSPFSVLSCPASLVVSANIARRRDTGTYVGTEQFFFYRWRVFMVIDLPPFALGMVFFIQGLGAPRNLEFFVLISIPPPNLCTSIFGFIRFGEGYLLYS